MASNFQTPTYKVDPIAEALKKKKKIQQTTTPGVVIVTDPTTGYGGKLYVDNQGNVIKDGGGSTRVVTTGTKTTKKGETSTYEPPKTTQKTGTVPTKVLEDVRRTTPSYSEYKQSLARREFRKQLTYTEYKDRVKQQQALEARVRKGEVTKRETPFETVYEENYADTVVRANRPDVASGMPAGAQRASGYGTRQGTDFELATPASSLGEFIRPGIGIMRGMMGGIQLKERGSKTVSETIREEFSFLQQSPQEVIIPAAGLAASYLGFKYLAPRIGAKVSKPDVSYNLGLAEKEGKAIKVRGQTSAKGRVDEFYSVIMPKDETVSYGLTQTGNRQIATKAARVAAQPERYFSESMGFTVKGKQSASAAKTIQAGGKGSMRSDVLAGLSLTKSGTGNLGVSASMVRDVETLPRSYMSPGALSLSEKEMVKAHIAALPRPSSGPSITFSWMPTGMRLAQGSKESSMQLPVVTGIQAQRQETEQAVIFSQLRQQLPLRRTRQGTRQRQSLSDMQIPMQTQAQVTRQQTKQLTLPKSSTRERERAMFGLGLNQSSTNRSFNIPSAKQVKEASGLGLPRASRQRQGYAPSLTSMLLGITGRRPPLGTWGVSLRPLPAMKGRKKKRKR